MVWGIIGSIVLLVLLISPFVSGLAHTRYHSWINDRVVGVLVSVGDWEWKQLRMSVTNCAQQNIGGTN